MVIKQNRKKFTKAGYTKLSIILVIIFSISATFYFVYQNFNKSQDKLEKEALTLLQNKYPYIDSISKSYTDYQPILCKENNINPFNYEVVTYNIGNSGGIVYYHNVQFNRKITTTGFQTGGYDSNLLRNLYENIDCNEIKKGFLIESTDYYSLSNRTLAGKIIPLSPFQKINQIKKPIDNDDINNLILDYRESIDYLPTEETKVGSFTIDYRKNILELPIFVCNQNKQSMKVFQILGVPFFGFSLQWYSIDNLDAQNPTVSYDGQSSWFLQYGIASSTDLMSSEIYNDDRYAQVLDCETLKNSSFISPKETRKMWKEQKIRSDSQEFIIEEKEIRQKNYANQLGFFDREIGEFNNLAIRFRELEENIEFRGTFYEYPQDLQIHFEDSQDLYKLYEDFREYETNLPKINPYEIRQERYKLLRSVNSPNVKTAFESEYENLKENGSKEEYLELLKQATADGKETLNQLNIDSTIKVFVYDNYYGGDSIYDKELLTEQFQNIQDEYYQLKYENTEKLILDN